MSFAQASALAEWGVVEIAGLDADGRGDMISDEFEPGALLGVKTISLEMFLSIQSTNRSLTVWANG